METSKGWLCGFKRWHWRRAGAWVDKSSSHARAGSASTFDQAEACARAVLCACVSDGFMMCLCCVYHSFS